MKLDFFGYSIVKKSVINRHLARLEEHVEAIKGFSDGTGNEVANISYRAALEKTAALKRVFGLSNQKAKTR